MVDIGFSGLGERGRVVVQGVVGAISESSYFNGGLIGSQFGFEI